MTLHERAEQVMDRCWDKYEIVPVNKADLLTAIESALREVVEECAKECDWECSCALHNELMPDHITECRIRNECAATIRKIKEEG